jgi:hypothetical protein
MPWLNTLASISMGTSTKTVARLEPNIGCVIQPSGHRWYAVVSLSLSRLFDSQGGNADTLCFKYRCT